MEQYQDYPEYDNSSDEERDEEREEMGRYQASPTEPTEVLRDLDKAFRQIEEGKGAEERPPEEVVEEGSAETYAAAEAAEEAPQEPEPSADTLAGVPEEVSAEAAPEETEKSSAEEAVVEEAGEERPSTRDLAAELAAEIGEEVSEPEEEEPPVQEEEKPEAVFSDMATSWQEVAEEAKAEEAPAEPSPEEMLAKELAAAAEEAPAEEEKVEETPAEAAEEAPADEAAEVTPAEEEKAEEVSAEAAEAVEKEEVAEETPTYGAVSEQAATIDVGAVTTPVAAAAAASEVQVDMEEVRTTLEGSAPVEGVEQLPRGAKYRRIRKEQLFQIVAELVRRYAATAMQQLAQREQQLRQLQEQLAEHQSQLESLRSDEAGLRAKAETLQQQLAQREAKVASLEAELAELREQADKLGAFGEKWLEKEDDYIRRIRELEEETNRLRSALETSGSQLQQKIEQLEQQIAVYKGRLEELQRGLEYVGFVEEFDVAGGLLQAAELRTKLEELTSGVGEATTRMMPASVRERLEFIAAKTREIEEKLNRYRDTYSQLVEKMENKEGTIAVAVDTAVMAERIRGLTDQLRVVAQMLEMVEAFMR